MVVPVGHERMYFHAGCEPPIRDKPDLAEDKIRSTSEAQYPSIQTEASLHQPFEVLNL